MRHRWIVFLALILGALMSSTAGYTAEQYIEDVLSGKQVTGKYTRLAVERHIRDLERVGDPEFPYYFDEAQAKRIIDFKQQLRHTKGDWANPRKHDTRIRLEPWQQFKDWVLFGWRDKNGYRRFTKAYIEVARKNGKTTDAAATANYMLFADRPKEMGPEIYCVGPKKDQGKISWEEAKRQIEKHPILKTKSRTYKQNSSIILYDDSAAKMTVWGRDAEMQDGFNPSFALIDEAHLYPGNEGMEVVESGMGSRAQPLIYIITTAGLDINSPIYKEERTLALQTLEQTIDPSPDNFFCMIFTLDEDDDWTDSSVWIKSNPNLGVSVSWKYIEDRVQTALQMPSRQNKVITKNLNVWTQSETRWIQADVWNRGNVPVNEEDLIGRPCYVGLDLSASQDITALVYDFPPIEYGGGYQQVYRFFIPGDNLRDKIRKDKVPYDVWIEKGFVIPTPGDVIDYDYIEQVILEDAEKFEILEVGYDPWKAQEIVNHLTESGFTMVPIYQRYSGMAAFTDAFEKDVLSGQIQHGGNPVMQWMVGCTEVKSDRQGNIMPMKPHRNKTGKRIDGVVASIMAHGRAVTNEGEGGSVYEERGMLSI